MNLREEAVDRTPPLLREASLGLALISLGLLLACTLTALVGANDALDLFAYWAFVSASLAVLMRALEVGLRFPWDVLRRMPPTTEGFRNG